MKTTHYYLCCGNRYQREQFLEGLEVLRLGGQQPVIGRCPVKSSINVVELTLNPEVPLADLIVRSMATAAGLCLIAK